MRKVRSHTSICYPDRVGVGKTSLLHRYIKGTFSPPSVASMIGASLLTKRVVDVDTGTTVRFSYGTQQVKRDSGLLQNCITEEQVPYSLPTVS